MTTNSKDLLANGASTAIISVKATDNESSMVPDGTKISFSISPANDGTLSSSYCATTNGACNVTYTSSTNPGNVTINAFSGTASTSTSLSLLKPQLYTKTIMPQETFSLQCGYYQDEEFTAPNSAYNVTVTGSFTSSGGPVNFAILTPNQMGAFQSSGYISGSVYETGYTSGEPFNYTLSGGTYYVVFINSNGGNGCYFWDSPTISVDINSPVTLTYYD